MTAQLPRIPTRALESHKGDFGHVVVAAGSVGMTGAAVLTGQSALRAGAGLVTLACPHGAWAVVAGHVREALVTPVGPEGAAGWTDAAAGDVEQLLGSLTGGRPALALGPGMGRSAEARACIRRLVSSAICPLVLDADGIVAFEGDAGALSARTQPTILTPHPGEARRLVGAFDGTEDARIAAAREIATRTKSVVVLKGHRSVVCDGEHTELNETGNPGMATGGSGDVLTGLIVGLLAIGLTPFDAARLGAHIHGRAGDLAVQLVGEVSLVAGDIVDMLPTAFEEHAS